MRLALLVSDDHHHAYLVALLDAQFEVCGVIVEPGRAQVARLRRRRRYIDWIYRRYHGLRRKLNGHARYRNRFFAERPDEAKRCYETVEVQWINSELAISTMKRWNPDVAVVCGTSYVQQRVLTPAGRTFNIHAGSLPYYKGNHGVFFALAEGRHELIGASLHDVSAQLDGGAVVEVVYPPVYPHDDDETLYCRADQLAMLRLVDLLLRIERGEAVPALAQRDVGRTYRHRDRTPWAEFRVWLRRRLGRGRCIPITRIETTIYDTLGPERREDPLIEYRRLER